MILLFVLVLVLEEHSEHLDGRSGWCEQARGNDKTKKKTKKNARQNCFCIRAPIEIWRVVFSAGR